VLLALFVVPTLDLVACPDGCTDAAYPASVHQNDVTAAHGLCNLCVNAIAADGVAPPVERLVRLAPVATPKPCDLPSPPPPTLERPPRLS
jgi:hypothetical protein